MATLGQAKTITSDQKLDILSSLGDVMIFFHTVQLAEVTQGWWLAKVEIMDKTEGGQKDSIKVKCKAETFESVVSNLFNKVIDLSEGNEEWRK